MQFTKEDKIVIKNLLELKGYAAKQLVREFPSKRMERRKRLEVIAKAAGYWDRRPSRIEAPKALRGVGCENF